MKLIMFYQVLNLKYKLLENCIYVPKHVGIARDHNFVCVCNLNVDLVL
jgi:hypothetical protein